MSDPSRPRAPLRAVPGREDAAALADRALRTLFALTGDERLMTEARIALIAAGIVEVERSEEREATALATWRGTLHERGVSVRVEGAYERWRWSYAIDGPGITSGAGVETTESDAVRVAFDGVRREIVGR